MPSTNNNNFVLGDESYKLIGMMFSVHNDMGPIYKEKHYVDAIEQLFIKYKIPYLREQSIALHFAHVTVPNFAPDFVVWNIIVLEIKARQFIQHEDIRQVSRYLDQTGLPLGILVNFKRQKLEYKRVINPKRDKIRWP